MYREVAETEHSAWCPLPQGPPMSVPYITTTNLLRRKTDLSAPQLTKFQTVLVFHQCSTRVLFCSGTSLVGLNAEEMPFSETQLSVSLPQQAPVVAPTGE